MTSNNSGPGGKEGVVIIPLLQIHRRSQTDASEQSPCSLSKAPNYEEAFSVLKNVGGGIAMKVIKTWLNGWATSHRMHEDNVLCCLLGYGDGSLDSLTRYIHCPHMLAFQKFLFENKPWANGAKIGDDNLLKGVTPVTAGV